MAKGGSWIGSGRKAYDLLELQQTGGFRKDRHAHLVPRANASPEIAALLQEIAGEYFRLTKEAKQEADRWAALQKERPTDVKVSTQRLAWSRHYQSSLLEIQRRLLQWMHAPKVDPFDEFQKRRHGHDSDPAA
jgi:hypothetical protein